MLESDGVAADVSDMLVDAVGQDLMVHNVFNYFVNLVQVISPYTDVKRLVIPNTLCHFSTHVVLKTGTHSGN